MTGLNLSNQWLNVTKVWEYRDGSLYWLIKCGRGIAVKHPGDKVIVVPDSLGYEYVTYKRKHFAVHRIVFLLTQGWLPDCIDHIDGNPTNNNASNLRSATRLQNQFNRRVNSKSKTGIKNVTPHQGKWQVRFSIKGKTKHYGCFEDIDFAEFVAHEVRLSLHRDFARHA